MKETRLLMGMPITVEVIDQNINALEIDKIYRYFESVDKRFSTYKETSEISLINKGKLTGDQYSEQMKEVFRLAAQTKNETNGFFDIALNGHIDPSGLVKGWAIKNAADILSTTGFKNFYVDAGGDIQVSGFNSKGEAWKIGIKNPFNEKEIIKVVYVREEGVATSGTYIRGQHIYNPHTGKQKIDEIVSLTVIGPNIYEADRFATAAFAMESEGINFIEELPGFEGYMINKNGIATFTSGFNKYTKEK